MSDEPKIREEDGRDVLFYTLDIPEDVSLTDIVNALDREGVDMQLTAEGALRLIRENEGGQTS